MSDDTTNEPAGERRGEHGAAARAGIVDQQDALLAEMEEIEQEEGRDPDPGPS
jgi:hypothetical protein